MFQKASLKLLFVILFAPFIVFAQKNNFKPAPKQKEFICTTFVYNLTLEEMKMKDICFEVIKGEFINMNEFSSVKKKENELWRFKIIIKDNQSLSKQNYEASFYIYENYSQDIIQYHPVIENEEFKAVIYDKKRGKWQILLFQNDEYKILSSYTGYSYTNAFDIKSRKKSSISY